MMPMMVRQTHNDASVGRRTRHPRREPHPPTWPPMGAVRARCREGIRRATSARRRLVLSSLYSRSSAQVGGDPPLRARPPLIASKHYPDSSQSRVLTMKSLKPSAAQRLSAVVLVHVLVPAAEAPAGGGGRGWSNKRVLTLHICTTHPCNHESNLPVSAH